MVEIKPDDQWDKLTLLIYLDSIKMVLTHNRSIIDTRSISFGSIQNLDNEIQTVLVKFYKDVEFDLGRIGQVNLIFVNSIFHKASGGVLETYKNRLPSFLLYHKEFFRVPVSYNHIAQLMVQHIGNWQNTHKKPVLWFHLRENLLFTGFGTTGGERSVNAFEVRKTLDIFYYILFNIQTLDVHLEHIKEITISGDLLNLAHESKFFKENVSDKKTITFWKWSGVLGRSPSILSSWLPEVNL